MIEQDSKHHVIFNSEQELYAVWCPEKEHLLPLAAEPNFCPMCGDKVKINTEGGDEKWTKIK